MTSNVKLLPLPVHNYVDGDGLWETATGPYSAEETQAYARANVAHATAAKDAEIEALRAGREVIVAEAVKYAERSGRLEAEVERLVEALRELVAYVWDYDPVGGDAWLGAVELLQKKAHTALRDHDQEDKNDGQG